MTAEKLKSEAVRPVFVGDGRDMPLTVGEPLVPRAVVWRGTTYPVLAVLETGRGLGPAPMEAASSMCESTGTASRPRASGCGASISSDGHVAAR